MKSYQIHQETDNTNAKQLGQSLAKAFYHEPNFTFILPDEASRQTELTWLFTFTVRLGVRYGTVYSDSEKTGAAIWLGPGQKIKSVGALLDGVLRMPFKLGLRSGYRSITLGNSVGKVREEIAPDNHWYLMAMGVNPTHQGEGMGNALLQPVLSRSEAAGQPCYLETFSRRIFPFYEKFGFRVMEKRKVANDGPEFWTMVRE